MSTNYDFDAHVRHINPEMLTPIVQKVVQKQSLVVTDWQWSAFMGTGGGTRNSAVYRFMGTYETDEQISLEWSLILKVIRYQEDADPSSSHYWKREFDAYQSGWLNQLPIDTIDAPTCYVAEVIPGEAVLLWLEDLQDAGTDWNRYKLAIVARHLGQFNGIYLTQAAQPNYPWFSKDWIRRDVETAAQFLPELGQAAERSFSSRILTTERIAMCHKIYNERNIFFNALDTLPKTIQHFDAFSENLFWRNQGGRGKTTIIDWAFVGLDAIGAELTSLFWVTLLFHIVEPSEVAEYERDVFEGYINGLQDVGWKGDVNLVRLGFTAALCLRHFGTMCYAQFDLQDEERVEEWVQYLGAPRDVLIEQWVAGGEHVDILAEEARQLITALRF